MSRRGKDRRAAYRAGELHADGGDDTRAAHAAKGCGERYDEGYRDHSARLASDAVATDDPYAIIRDLLAELAGPNESAYASVIAARAYLGE